MATNQADPVKSIVDDLLRSLVGLLTTRHWIHLDSIVNSIQDAATSAYRSGAASTGSRVPTDTAAAKVLPFVAAQTSAMAAFIVEVSGADIAEIERRAAYYANAIRSQYWAGLIDNAGPDVEIVWNAGPTSDKCADCVRMAAAGPMSVAKFRSTGFLPQSWNLACKGLHCQCWLSVTRKTTMSRIQVNLIAPASVREACQRGLDMVAAGIGGVGTSDETIAWATRLAAGFKITRDRANRISKWWRIGKDYLTADDQSPLMAAALLHGGATAKGWLDDLLANAGTADFADLGSIHIDKPMGEEKDTDTRDPSIRQHPFRCIDCSADFDGDGAQRYEICPTCGGHAINVEFMEPGIDSFRHAFSSTEIWLDPKVSERVKFHGDNIPTADMHMKGVVDRPHITVCYGIHAHDPHAVHRVVKGAGPITYKITGVSCFDAADSGAEFDVVKYDIESPALQAIHDRIRAHLSTTRTHPVYHPHATIAYVKPGRGDAIAKMAVDKDDLIGTEHSVDEIIFSDIGGRITRIPLEGDGPPASTFVSFHDDDRDVIIGRADMAVKFSLAGATSPYVQGDHVYYPNSKLFECGDYPDKGFSLSESEMDHAVKNFTPVKNNLEHVPTLLDGKLGDVVEVRKVGKSLMGTVRVPTWLDAQLPADKPVSCEWGKASKLLDGLGLVLNPRVTDAALMAAFSAAEAAHVDMGAESYYSSPHQVMHDMSCAFGADCDGKSVFGSSDKSGLALFITPELLRQVQKHHDIAKAAGADCDMYKTKMSIGHPPAHMGYTSGVPAIGTYPANMSGKPGKENRMSNKTLLDRLKEKFNKLPATATPAEIAATFSEAAAEPDDTAGAVTMSDDVKAMFDAQEKRLTALQDELNATKGVAADATVALATTAKSAHMTAGTAWIESLADDFKITSAEADKLKAQLETVDPAVFNDVVKPLYEDREPIPALVGFTGGARGEDIRRRREGAGGSGSDHELVKMAKDRAKSEKINFGAALLEVSAENPKLAEEYRAAQYVA